MIFRITFAPTISHLATNRIFINTTITSLSFINTTLFTDTSRHTLMFGTFLLGGVEISSSSSVIRCTLPFSLGSFSSFLRLSSRI